MPCKRIHSSDAIDQVGVSQTQSLLRLFRSVRTLIRWQRLTPKGGVLYGKSESVERDHIAPLYNRLSELSTSGLYQSVYLSAARGTILLSTLPQPRCEREQLRAAKHRRREQDSRP